MDEQKQKSGSDQAIDQPPPTPAPRAKAKRYCKKGKVVRGRDKFVDVAPCTVIVRARVPTRISCEVDRYRQALCEELSGAE